jgi:hypothetical protein
MDGDAQGILFDKNGQGILAIWNKSGLPQTADLPLALGKRALKVDLWGNATPLTSQGGLTRVQVGRMPFFLVGVDALSMQLRAGLAFDQSLLESTYQTHTRRLMFTNPSADVLSGTLHLHPPKGWSISPASFQFSLNPGKNFDEQVTIEFPYNSLSGPETVQADFQLEGQDGAGFSVPLTLTLGLSDVGMQCLALRDGKDLLVEEMITNYSEKPIDYTAYAAYPGLIRLERLVISLDPGLTSIKLYRFKNVKFIPGATVRCGLRQLEGTRVLNEEASVQ